MIKKKNRNYIERYALSLLLFDKEAWTKYCNIIDTNMFKSESRQIIFRFAKAHSGTLTYKMLSHELRQRSNAIGGSVAIRTQAAYADLKKFKTNTKESEYVFKSLIKYNSTEETFKWMKQYIELVENGEIEKAEDLKLKHFLHSSSMKTIGIDKGEIVKDFKDRYNLLKDKMTHPEKYRLAKTGIKKLDKAIGGIAKGEFVLLAGHTSRGKSTIALNIAYRNQLMGGKVLYFVNEMPRIQVETKYDSLVSKIKYTKFKFAKLNRKQINIWKRKIKNLRKFGGEFHVISVANNCTPTLIREMVKMHGDVSLVIIDSLLYMDSSTRGFSEQADLGNITKELKGIAMQYDVPVLALTQLTAESIEKEKLDYADIGYSRKMGHIADIIIAIPNIQDDEDAISVQLVKFRDGARDAFFKIYIDWSICRVNNKPPREDDDQEYITEFED